MRRTSRTAQAGEEGGFALVTAIIVLFIAVLVAGVALAATVSNRSISTRSDRAQRAQQAADSGLQSVIYQLNQNPEVVAGQSTLEPLTTTLACLPLRLNAVLDVAATFTVVGLSPPASGCGSGSGSASQLDTEVRTGQHTAYKVYLDPGQTTVNGATRYRPYLVAVGVEDKGTASTSDDVVRRSKAVLDPITPLSVVEGTRDVTINGLQLLLSLSNTVLNGDISAGDDLDVNALSLLGLQTRNLLDLSLRTSYLNYVDQYSGPLVTLGSRQQIASSTVPERKPVSIDAAKPDCPPSLGCPSSSVYSSSTHYLVVPSGSSVTLGAGDYVFCGVSVASGGTLTTSSTGTTRVYVDSPQSARCSGAPTQSYKGSIAIRGALLPLSVSPSLRQFYVVGSNADASSASNDSPTQTTVTIEPSNLTASLASAYLVYAPLSDVSIRFTIFTGALIGHDVVMTPSTLLGSAAPTITQDLGLSKAALSASIGAYSQRRFVECKPTRVTSAAPGVDC